MRSALAIGLFTVLCGCASSAAHAPPTPPAPVQEEPPDAPEEEPPSSTAAAVDAPERTRPPSTASYEQAMSKPEPVDTEDHRVQLTDAQLRGPMNGVLNGCRVPGNARVTIKTAVQFGRAIGVTVDVRFEHPVTPGKRLSRSAAAATARSEAKTKKKVVSCVDHAVREVVWPPSNRRDSFTTEF